MCIGYVETSVDELTSALYKGLSSYSQLPNLVFFKEAVHHMARLSRVLVGSSHVSMSVIDFIIVSNVTLIIVTSLYLPLLLARLHSVGGPD